MKIIHFALLAFLTFFLVSCDANNEAKMPKNMIVYKSPTCGCCEDWIKHVEKAGFIVEIHDIDDVDPIKDGWGVPKNMRSCHVA